MRNQFDDDDGARPDVAEVVAQVSDVFRRNLRRFGPILLAIIVIALLLGGVYKVGPGEQGVVRTFGRESGKTGPGLHYAFPIVQRRDVVNVEEVRRMEIGYRADQRVASEALMLTGDENIVEAQMIVQYRVTDPSRYLFELKDAEETLRATAEVALRSMVGRTIIDDVITTGREKVQSETRAWLQKLMDDYQSGLSVTEVKLLAADAPDEVKDAFHDVVRAREEKEKLINQAKGYAADLIPRARGEARKMEREAEAYKEERVLQASGDAQKYLSMLVEYDKGQRVTRDRLYLETMERVLGKIDRKIVVDEALAKGSVPILQLDGARGAVAAAAAGGAK
jgi:membrane protease subunit HflK